MLMLMIAAVVTAAVGAAIGNTLRWIYRLCKRSRGYTTIG